MNDDLHNIDDLFKNSVERHEEPVPSRVWEGVSHDLDKKQALLYERKYHRLKAAVLFFATVVFMVGAGALYYSFERRQEVSSPAASKPVHHDNLVLKSRNTVNPKSDPFAERQVGLPPVGDSAHNIIPLSIQHEKSSLDNPKRTAATDDFYRTNSIVQKSKSIAQIDASSNHIGQQFLRKQAAGPKKLHLFFMDTQYAEKSTATINQLRGPVDVFPLPMPADKNIRPFFSKTIRTVDLMLSSVIVDHIATPPGYAVSKIKLASPPAFSLTAFIAPNINIGHLKDDEHSRRPGRGRDEIRRDEEAAASFSAGLLFNYKLSGKLILQSGITVTSSASKLSPQKIYAREDDNGNTHYELQCSSGYSFIKPAGGTQPLVGDSLQTSGGSSKLMYVSIPAILSLNIPAGRFSFQPGIGAAANILVNASTQTSLVGSSGKQSATNNIQGLKSMYTEARVGIGAAFQMTRRVQIGLRPTFRWAPTPINKKTAVLSYANYASLEAGVSVRL